MKMKKWIAACVALTTLCLTLAGCGNKPEPVETTEDGRMVISWMSGNFAGGAQEGTYPETLIEETFDVEIEPCFVSITSSFNESKSMMFASGEITDVIYEYDPANVKADVEQDLLAEIPYETIKKYAPTVYKNICEQAPITWLYGMVDGKNYGIPNLSYTSAYSRMGLIRTDWLEKLGLEQPETLNELHDVLYAFTHNDPDGNGVKDTYGISTDSKQVDCFFNDVFGAHGILPFNWNEVDGKAVYGGLQPETVEALRLLSEWYKEGLIHPDFITDDNNGQKEKFTNGVTGFISSGITYQDPSNSNNVINLVSQITGGKAEYMQAVAHDETGHRGTFSWGAPAHTISFAKHIEEQPEKLQKFLEIIEAYSTDIELLKKLRLGEQGTHWNFIDSNMGFKGGVKFLEPYTATNEQKRQALMSTFGSPGFFTPSTPPYEMWLELTREDEIKTYETYASKDHAMYDIFGKADTLPSAEKYLADLRAKQLALMTKTITGEITPEEYLSQFSALWNQHGGTEMEAEAAEMQKSIDVMYQQLGIQ